MGTYSFEQRKNIILTNPNKALINDARKQRKEYMLHVLGEGLLNEVKTAEHLENDTLLNVRKKFMISNMDLCQRLLNNENQVFTATGGSANFQLPESDEKQMRSLLDNVIYGMPLSKWVETFALQAYRCDPMSVIFMECDEIYEFEGETYPMPECYPTYKSSGCIYDYMPNGRKLEYICFELSTEELQEYGLKDETMNIPEDMAKYITGSKTQYYRFVDDSEDVIYKRENNNITVANLRQKNPIVNTFGRVPAFIVSDLIQFNNPRAFGSPLQFVKELLDTFLNDRSVRELHKKLHGFPKPVEPLVMCTSCDGVGMQQGKPCPDCTIDGQTKGTGYKLKTRPADVARFPLELLKDANFDFRKLFGYVSMDVESLDKMDLSLIDLEALIHHTYWGTYQARVVGFNGHQDVEKTATQALLDIQPMYARLNKTADWRDQTETMIADFIGEYWFKDSWRGAAISSGRNYSLETPQLLMEAYHEMRTKGTPDCVLDDQFKRYIRALYQNNPKMQAMMLKFFDIEPFPHATAEQVDASMTIPIEDKLQKRYYGEWFNSLKEPQKFNMKKEALLQSLADYVNEKTKAVKQQQEDEAKKQMQIKNN